MCNIISVRAYGARLRRPVSSNVRRLNEHRRRMAGSSRRRLALRRYFASPSSSPAQQGTVGHCRLWGWGRRKIVSSSRVLLSRLRDGWFPGELLQSGSESPLSCRGNLARRGSVPWHHVAKASLRTDRLTAQSMKPFAARCGADRLVKPILCQVSCAQRRDA